MKRICVFCGSRTGRNPLYAETARAVGALIAQRGLGLVYGGGTIGLMGQLADAALAAGGEVIGIIPDALDKAEIGHRGVSDLRIVATMHERKALMAAESDAFLVLPGGAGTLEEAFEAWTWAQLGIHRKPLGFLNVGGFYDPLIAFLDHQVAEDFIRPAHRQMVLIGDEPSALIDRLLIAELPLVDKWASAEQI